MSSVAKSIEVVEYNADWPKLFEIEALSVKRALGDNCIAIHHVGSTSIPGLISKPIIDIIAVVKNGKDSTALLGAIGFEYKGEWNIPFKYGFTKRTGQSINLHVYEERHSEIKLNIMFRDYLKAHPKSLKEYAELKTKLLSNDSSFYKNESRLFSGYNLGKDVFIRKVLNACGYESIRFLRCVHNEEIEHYHRIKKEQIFDPLDLTYNPNHPSFSEPQHMHFVLTKGVTIVAIAHIEFLSSMEVALRAIATDKSEQTKGFGKAMILFTERYCKENGVKIIKLHSSIETEGFYRKLGYTDMFFDDESIKPVRIDLGKTLTNSN